jgi:hypothetical protein
MQREIRSDGNGVEVVGFRRFDYVWSENLVVPIEVKSGRAKSGGSLRAFMDAYRPKCAIRISERNFGLSEGIRAVPHYAVFCIQ